MRGAIIDYPIRSWRIAKDIFGDDECVPKGYWVMMYGPLEGQWDDVAGPYDSREEAQAAMDEILG